MMKAYKLKALQDGSFLLPLPFRDMEWISYYTEIPTSIEKRGSDLRKMQNVCKLW